VGAPIDTSKAELRKITLHLMNEAHERALMPGRSLPVSLLLIKAL
jgi:hypothetical protein